MSQSIQRKPSTFFTYDSKSQPTLWEVLGIDGEGKEMIRTAASGPRGKVYDAQSRLGNTERSWVSGRRAAQSDARDTRRAEEAFVWPRPTGEDAWSSTGDTGVPNQPRVATAQIAKQSSTRSRAPTGDDRSTRRAAPDNTPAATRPSGRAPVSQYMSSIPAPPPSSPVSTANRRAYSQNNDDEMDSLADRVRFIPVPQISTRSQTNSASRMTGTNTRSTVPSKDQTRPSVNPQKMFGDPNLPTRVPDKLPSSQPRSSDDDRQRQGSSGQSGTRTEPDYGGQVGSPDRRPLQQGGTRGSGSFPTRTRSGLNMLPDTLSRPSQHQQSDTRTSGASNYLPVPRLSSRTNVSGGYPTPAPYGVSTTSSTRGTQGSSLNPSSNDPGEVVENEDEDEQEGESDSESDTGSEK